MKDIRCHTVETTLTSSVATYSQCSCSVYLGQQNFSSIIAHREHQNNVTLSVQQCNT